MTRKQGLSTRFKPGPDPRRNTRGREKGSKNRWQKADLTKMREHIHTVLDRCEGGIEEYLGRLLAHPKTGWPLFNALLRDMTPKPAMKVEADATIAVRWETQTPDGVEEN